jgi:sporulation protein YlmC with PRC-barrel domain
VYAFYGGSFLADAPLPKSLYNSVKIIIYFDIISLVGNYIVVNEFKSLYENKKL